MIAPINAAPRRLPIDAGTLWVYQSVPGGLVLFMGLVDNGSSQIKWPLPTGHPITANNNRGTYLRLAHPDPLRLPLESIIRVPF
jgi:hypothetical protein